MSNGGVARRLRRYESPVSLRVASLGVAGQVDVVCFGCVTRGSLGPSRAQATTASTSDVGRCLRPLPGASVSCERCWVEPRVP